jgi:hypothetical protein
MEYRVIGSQFHIHKKQEERKQEEEEKRRNALRSIDKS